MTLTEFLLARIAEDQTAVQGDDTLDTPHREACGYDILEFSRDCSCGYPARVLADCAAKRRIVELADKATMYEDIVWQDRGLSTDPGYNDPRAGEQILAVLASVYADHPDYQEEWRP